MFLYKPFTCTIIVGAKPKQLLDPLDATAEREREKPKQQRPFLFVCV